ncbi:MAG TPA: SRPBCC family protein [Bryobacteraceae bacterium]|jgi:uncharacterized membrane protein
MAMEDRPRYNGRQRGRSENQQRLTNGLGWFSIGLGLAEVAAPGQVARLIGVSDTGGKRALLRAYGLREVAAGVGILSQPRPAGWLWGRVAGDMLDLASLGSALTSEKSDRVKVAAAAAAVAGVTALDIYCGAQLSRGEAGNVLDKRVQLTKSIIINRSPEEVYRYWHDLGNVPKFMSWIESVQVTGGVRSHWKAKGPGGVTAEWDAEMVNDEPNALIAWRSVEGSDIHNSGTVRFEPGPGGQGARVTVELQHSPSGAGISARVARFLGRAPGQQLQADLRRLKQILETGEIVNSDASIHRGTHAAQPSGTTEGRDAGAEARQAKELRPSLV